MKIRMWAVVATALEGWESKGYGGKPAKLNVKSRSSRARALELKL
jgi:hypothetical protein